MNWYRTDLHIHSVLSPCCSLEMSAHSVMNTARNKGLSILAITDHNSMANCAVYGKVARELGLTFFWGVEIQSIEEIHLIAIFDNEKTALDFDRKLYESLQPVDNNPEFFGDQVVIDEDENIVRFEKKALINSSRWTLNELVDRLKSIDCFYFPAHTDAESYSIIGQLGFIPEELDFPALGITASCDIKSFLQKHPTLANYGFIRNSDAHYLDQIGKGYTDFYLKEPTTKELRLACQKTCQRKYVI